MEIQAVTVTATVATTVLSTVFVENPSGGLTATDASTLIDWVGLWLAVFLAFFAIMSTMFAFFGFIWVHGVREDIKIVKKSVHQLSLRTESGTREDGTEPISSTSSTSSFPTAIDADDNQKITQRG